MRRPQLLPLLLLMSSCNLCQPPNPSPPPADSCQSPSTDIGLQTLEVGGASDGPFLAWPEDGTDVLLTQGGQGANMLGVRVRIHTSQPVECIAQKTVFLDADGTEYAKREEPLKTYAAPDGSRVTKTLWMVPNGGSPQSGQAAQVRIEIGGQQLVRRVVLQSEYLLPSPLGIQATTLCHADVPVLVGLDGPALNGSVAVIESDALTPGLSDVLFRTGESIAEVTLHPTVTTGKSLKLHAYGTSVESSVVVSESTQGELAEVSPSTLGIAARGTSLVEVNITCAGASDSVVTLSSEPAGILTHATQVRFTRGITRARVRLSAPATFTGQVTLHASLNGTTRDVVIHGSEAQSPEGLRLSEVLTHAAAMKPGDSNCDGSSGETDTFVELHNPTSEPIDLAGVTLQNLDYNNAATTLGVFPAGRVLGAGERAVFLGGTPSSGTSVWCAALRAAGAQGYVVQLQTFRSLYDWRTLRITHGGTTLDEVLAQDLSYAFTNEGHVISHGTEQEHRLAPRHAVDRLFTPGDDEDGLGAF